jgi:hypothetical protein
MTTPNNGAVAPELKSALAELHNGIKNAASASEVKRLQAQVDAIDVKLANRAFGEFVPGSSLRKSLQENESVSRLLRDRKGRGYITLKGHDYGEVMAANRSSAESHPAARKVTLLTRSALRRLVSFRSIACLGSRLKRVKS